MRTFKVFFKCKVQDRLMTQAFTLQQYKVLLSTAASQSLTFAVWAYASSYTHLCRLWCSDAYKSSVCKEQCEMVAVRGEKANCCGNVLHHSNEPITTFLHPIKPLAPLTTFMTPRGQRTSSFSSATHFLSLANHFLLSFFY